jgi:FkbM family methyltransferase
MITLSRKELLPFAQQFLPPNPVIVEGGAYIGHDTIRMATQWPKSTIHSFEPVPEFFDQLVKQTAHFSHVSCYPLALSDKEGTKELHLSYKKGQLTQASSFHEPHERLTLSHITFDRSVLVPTTTLHAWTTTHNIRQIDFLWLDLQGHEQTVLQSSLTCLSSVTLLYTEVYFKQAYKDHLLIEPFLVWLQTHGFVPIAKDFLTTEKWFFGNVLCINQKKMSTYQHLLKTD